MQGKCMFWSGLGGVLQCKHMGRGVEKSLLECCMKRGKGWHPCGSRLGRGPVSSSSTLFFTFSGFQSPLARKLQMRPWRGRGREGPVISHSHFEQPSSDSELSTLKHLLSPHRTVPVTSQPCGKSVLGILRGQRGGKSAAEHGRELGVTQILPQDPAEGEYPIQNKEPACLALLCSRFCYQVDTSLHYHYCSV